MRALYIICPIYILISRQPEPSTCPALEESIGVNCMSNHPCLLCCAQSAPVVLSEIRIVHEQWSIYVRKKPVLHVLVDDITHSTVQVLGCSVNCSVGACEEIGEVKFDNDVVVSCLKVHQVL